MNTPSSTSHPASIRLGGQLIELLPGAGARVMAIVNLTPDSFYAGSRSESHASIAQCIERAVEQGADLIDLGGYSSRPGAADIQEAEELERLTDGFEVARVVAGVDFPLSIDTFRSGVVEQLFDRFGSFLVNDISAGMLDSEMLSTVGRLGLPYIAMHMRGTPQTMATLTDYPEGVVEVELAYFRERIAAARAAGIRDLVLDPGFGFAKTTGQNFELLRRLSELYALGLPLLIGVSRKGMIWKTLGVTPAEALNGTTALHWEALRQGASILRVHDVREAREVIRLFGYIE